MTIDVNGHQLASKHKKVSDSERESLFKKYNIDSKSLPKINKNDPAIVHLNLKQGDVVKVVRKSKTAGKTDYYRGVIDG